ncbi:MAG: HAMP domain-containing sensor histidine kinase [bacterium]
MKRIAALAALALALAGLAWGLITLHRVFAAERAEAIDTVDARRRVLDRYAAQAFEARLARRLADARPALDAAEADPLAPAAGLYRRRRDVVVVPPVPAPAADTDAWALYEALRDPTHRPEPPPGPWGEWLTHREALLDAVAAGGRETIALAFRALLAHRARHRLDPALEIPATLAVLDWFADAAPVDPALARALLHDGLGREPAHVEGLQRALIRHRDRFDPADLTALAAEIERQSRRFGLPRAAFTAALTPQAPPPAPADIAAPTLAAGWYFAPRGDTIDGVRPDLPAEAAAVEAAMRDAALLGPDEGLTLDPDAAVPVAVRSPEWRDAPARAHATWRLKRALMWLTALLALALAALAALDARRRRRFVELKSDFIAAVSHELRTPLAAIRLMAETLERRLADVPRARDYPARIVREADALGFLVENLLSFNRIDKGRWIARPQPLALRDLVDRVRDGADAAFEATIRWQIEGIDGLTLDADPALVELLLQNLVRNAIQHHGGETVTLTLTARQDPVLGPGPGLTLTLADDGPGIPPEAAPRIFEPFYRGPARTSRGSGLGLALCRRIMTLHRGRIRLAATGPDGTTFELHFPRKAPAR